MNDIGGGPIPPELPPGGMKSGGRRHAPRPAGKNQQTVTVWRTLSLYLGRGLCARRVGAGRLDARLARRSMLDGFPAKLVSTLTGPPPIPGWALPRDAVATLRRVQR